MAHRVAVVVRRRARVAAMTVIVQAVMIGRQVVVVAQQANLPMAIAVKRGQPVVPVLKAAIVQTVMVLRDEMIAQIAMPVQIVIAALKGAMIKPAQFAVASHHLVTNQHAAASHHLVTNQHAAASHHLAASPPLTSARILVISQRRKSHHPATAMVARNAHHLRQKSASAHHGQAVMPHRRAAKAH